MNNLDKFLCDHWSVNILNMYRYDLAAFILNVNDIGTRLCLILTNILVSHLISLINRDRLAQSQLILVSDPNCRPVYLYPFNSFKWSMNGILFKPQFVSFFSEDLLASSGHLYEKTF